MGTLARNGLILSFVDFNEKYHQEIFVLIFFYTTELSPKSSYQNLIRCC